MLYYGETIFKELGSFENLENMEKDLKSKIPNIKNNLGVPKNMEMTNFFWFLKRLSCFLFIYICCVFALYVLFMFFLYVICVRSIWLVLC